MKCFKFYLIFLLLSGGILSNAQYTEADSLKWVLLKMKEDSNKVNTLNALAELSFRASPDEVIKYGSEAKVLAEELGFQRGLAMAYNNLGFGHVMPENYMEALKNWEAALVIYEELGDEGMVATILSKLGSTYYIVGEYVDAIEYSLRALKMAEEQGDKANIGATLLTIGHIYSKQAATLDTARNYYLRAIEAGESGGDLGMMGLGSVSLGEVYLEKKEYDSAFHYFEKSLTILTSSKDIAVVLTHMGNIYSQKEDYQMAIKYYNDALSMATKGNAQREKIYILQALASVHEAQDNPQEAIDCYKQAETIAEENGLYSELSSTYEGLASNYAVLQDFSKAYKYLSLQNTIDNTLQKNETENHAKDLINAYQLEKKQNEITLLEQQSKIEHLSGRRQRGFLIGTAVFGLLILALAGGLLHRMRFIRRTREKINVQKELITDSINYAQRLQSAMLPSRELLEEVMPEHFVILKPKDIVSGDFYWVKEVHDHLVIVGADCTGHGVPGAFMSMLGITLLSDLIDDHCFDAPSAILEKLREKVKSMLVQDGHVDELKDGMDMALAIFNKSTRELHFAGANNPLYVIRHKEVPAGKDLESFACLENGAYILYELKGDKQPIGIHWEEKKFTNRSIMLSENDSFYLFSDGFADQFGGEQRKKYKSLNFKKLLLSMQEKPMVHQKQLLEEAFESWRGEQEQIDDVSVIGVRI